MGLYILSLIDRYYGRSNLNKSPVLALDTLPYVPLMNICKYLDHQSGVNTKTDEKTGIKYTVKIPSELNTLASVCKNLSRICQDEKFRRIAEHIKEDAERYKHYKQEEHARRMNEMEEFVNRMSPIITNLYSAIEPEVVESILNIIDQVKAGKSVKIELNPYNYQDVPKSEGMLGTNMQFNDTWLKILDYEFKKHKIIIQASQYETVGYFPTTTSYDYMDDTSRNKSFYISRVEI